MNLMNLSMALPIFLLNAKPNLNCFKIVLPSFMELIHTQGFCWRKHPIYPKVVSLTIPRNNFANTKIKKSVPIAW